MRAEHQNKRMAGPAILWVALLCTSTSLGADFIPGMNHQLGTVCYSLTPTTVNRESTPRCKTGRVMWLGDDIICEFYNGLIDVFYSV